MKTLKFFTFFAALTLLVPPVFAESDFTLSGQFNLLGTLKQLPSRDEGVTAFSIPSIRLDLEVPLKESNALQIELESSEFRDATSKRYDTQLKEGYLVMRSLLPNAEIEYGLVPNPWVQYEREEWDYDFWGPTSEQFLIRYKYSSWADLGVVMNGVLENDIGEWAISAVNGEGAETEEIGKYKEFQVIFNLQALAPFFLTAGYLQGRYDLIDDSFNTKRRLMVEASYASELSLVSLTYYNTQDPADTLTAGTMAGGVDVRTLHGSNVEGQAVSLLARRKFTARTDVFLRGDWLQPVKTRSDATLKALAGGVAFQSTEDLLWVLGAESTTYSETFSTAARDQAQFLLATQVRF
jgi:hypothetical protein